MARLGPRFLTPKSPRRKFMWVPFGILSQETRHIIFLRAQKGVLGGGHKVYLGKVYVLFPSLILLFGGQHGSSIHIKRATIPILQIPSISVLGVSVDGRSLTSLWAPRSLGSSSRTNASVKPNETFGMNGNLCRGTLETKFGFRRGESWGEVCSKVFG